MLQFLTSYDMSMHEQMKETDYVGYKDMQILNSCWKSARDYSIKVASEKQFSPSDSVEFQTNIYTDIQRRRAIENKHFDELLEKIREIKKEFITNEEKAQKIRELQ